MGVATSFANLVKVGVSGTPGTGAITLGAAIAPFFGVGELTDGATYAYTIVDGNNVASGHGVYTASGTSLARDAAERCNVAGTPQSTPMSLTSSAIVLFEGILAADVFARGGPIPPSIRQASKAGCYFSAFQTNLATQVMSSQLMWIWTLGGAVQFEFGGFYTDSGGDHNSGATTTVTAGLEYPLGVTSVGATFGGSGSGSYASGGTALCDPVGNLPAGWSLVRVRIYQTNPNGVPLGGYSNSPANPFGLVNFGTSGIADLTQSTTAVTAVGGTSITCTPYAVLALTDIGSDFLEGDSRTLGAYDSPSDSSGDSGNIARLMGAAGRAYINGGVGGMTAATEASGLPTSPRLHFMKRCTSGYCGLGINDPGAGRSSAQALADRATVTGIVAANVQSGVVRGGSLEPLTTSTDSFVTLANQTVSANESKRLAINAGIRAGIAGEVYVFDFDVAADPGATGKWPVGNYPGLDSGVANSLDGIHGQNNFSQKFIKPFIGSIPCATRP